MATGVQAALAIHAGAEHRLLDGPGAGEVRLDDLAVGAALQEWLQVVVQHLDVSLVRLHTRRLC